MVTRGSGVLSSTGDVLVRGVGGECVTCVCVWLGAVWLERGGEWMRELGLGFTNPLGKQGECLDMCPVFWLRWCGWCRWRVGWGAWTGVGSGGGWCYVCVRCESGFLCVDGRSKVSVYCAWRIPAHLRCTQYSILLHLMDICFLTCICLWQISQIQTFLFKVVGPGLVSTSPRFL